MLVLAGEFDHLGNLGLGDLIRKDAADADAALVDVQHHPCGILDAHLEEALQDVDDEFHRRVIVVQVLQVFFKMNIEDATRVMLAVHQRGVGVCGIFTYEVAETKVAQVIDYARQNQHPLQCTLEKA